MLAQLLDYGVVANLGKCIGVSLDILEQGLELNSLRFSLRILTAEFAHVLCISALVPLNVRDPDGRLVFRQSSAGGLHLAANVVKLPRKPFGRLHNGIVPTLKSIFDKRLDQGVGYLGRELRIVAGKADLHKPARGVTSHGK